MTIRQMSTLLGIMALAGCVYIPIGSIDKLPIDALTTGGGLTLHAKPAIQNGGYTTLSNVITPYSSSDVTHLYVKLFKVAKGNEIAVVDAHNNPMEFDLLPASYSAQLSFTGLYPNTNYRIRAYAYKALGTAANDKISLDASSSLDVSVTNDAEPALQTIPVQLIDKLFNGVGTSSFSFASGSVVDSTSDVAIN